MPPVLPIEVEARAYVEAYGDRYGGRTGQAFEYLTQMFAIIDGLRADIRRLEPLDG